MRIPCCGNCQPETGVSDHGFCPEAEIASSGQAGERAGFSEYGIPVPADFGVIIYTR